MRVLICTRGSWGDVLPYVGLSRELQARGHEVLMVVNAANLKTVSARQISCVAFDSFAKSQSKQKDFKGLTQSLLGSLKVLRKLGQHLQAEVDCISHHASNFDVIVGSQTSLAAPLVARATGKPWAFSAVSPMAFFSFIDPPYLHGLRWLRADSPLPAWWKDVLKWFFLKLSDVVYVEYRNVERRLNLPHQHPLFHGRYSQSLNLALFSSLLAPPQVDWPNPYVQCDPSSLGPSLVNRSVDHELKDFLESGPPPVVFTLGSVSRVDPRDFYDVALKVVAKLGIRAVFVKRAEVQMKLDPTLPIHVCTYADYSVLFEAAIAVVHHGGIATLMHALRAGKPSLILPRTLDQFDHAERARRLGVAKVIPFMQLTESRMCKELKKLLLCCQDKFHLFDVDEAPSTMSCMVKTCKEIENLLRATPCHSEKIT